MVVAPHDVVIHRTSLVYIVLILRGLPIRPTVQERRVERALEFLAQNYACEISLPQLARHVRLSAWHLDRLIVASTGIGFRKHRVVLRISHAARLMIESDLSVKEVAATVGYRSSTQLGRDCARYFGLLPLTIRRTLRTRDDLIDHVEQSCDLDRVPIDRRRSLDVHLEAETDTELAGVEGEP